MKTRNALHYASQETLEAAAHEFVSKLGARNVVWFEENVEQIASESDVLKYLRLAIARQYGPRSGSTPSDVFV